MTALFCCDAIKPHRPGYLDHEAKFTAFMDWVRSNAGNESNVVEDVEAKLAESKPLYAVQLVRQVNFGPLEGKRYFVPAEANNETFAEVTENDLIQGNFQKLNSYKNFKCDEHNKFFEVNFY